MKPAKIIYKKINGIIFSDENYGSVELRSCPAKTPLGRCSCLPACSICGNKKHSAVHGPVLGEAEGSKPWGHCYKGVSEK